MVASTRAPVPDSAATTHRTCGNAPSRLSLLGPESTARLASVSAVERTVPFGMLTLTILTCWYHHAGTAGDDLAARLAA